MIDFATAIAALRSWLRARGDDRSIEQTFYFYGREGTLVAVDPGYRHVFIWDGSSWDVTERYKL